MLRGVPPGGPRRPRVLAGRPEAALRELVERRAGDAAAGRAADRVRGGPGPGPGAARARRAGAGRAAGPVRADDRRRAAVAAPGALGPRRVRVRRSSTPPATSRTAHGVAEPRPASARRPASRTGEHRRRRAQPAAAGRAAAGQPRGGDRARPARAGPGRAGRDLRILGAERAYLFLRRRATSTSSCRTWAATPTATTSTS